MKYTGKERLQALLAAYSRMDFYTPNDEQYRKNVHVMEEMIEELGGEHDGSRSS